MGATPAHEHPGDASVTWVINHQVRPARRAEFEGWLDAVALEVERFPGHLGTTYLRPGGTGGNRYVTIVRFATYDDLRHWEASTERARWLRTLPDLVVGAPEYEAKTGLETWFQLPESPSETAPPRYKMALLVTLAIYPLLLIVIPVLSVVLGDYPFLANRISFGPEFFTRTLVTVAILVPLMTWVAMPRITRLFRRWLYPTS